MLGIANFPSGGVRDATQTSILPLLSSASPGGPAPAWHLDQIAPKALIDGGLGRAAPLLPSYPHILEQRMRVLRAVCTVAFLALTAGPALAQDRYATLDVRGGYTKTVGRGGGLPQGPVVLRSRRHDSGR